LTDLFNYVGQTSQSPAIPKVPSPTDDLFSYVKAPPKFTREQILQSPEDMSSIRDMMIASKGTDFKEKSDEEVFDTFMSHMRMFNTNEAMTAKEAIDVFSSDEKTKAAYGRGYEVYDKIGGLFSGGGGDLGDKYQGVKDYGWAILTSPSTYLGGILGKGVSRLATQGAKEKLISEVGEAVMKEATKKGVSSEAKKEVKKELVRMTLKADKKAAMAGSLLIEAPVANIQDTLYQKTMMEAGAQDEFSYVQNALSTFLGGSMALTAPLFSKQSKGASGLADVEGQIKSSTKTRKARSVQVVKEEVTKAVKAANADWIALAERGGDLDVNKELRDSVMSWFTDYKNEGGFISILQRAGADLDVKTSGGFSRSLVNFAQELDQPTKEALNEAFSPLGITFDQVVTTFAATTRQAGQSSNLISSASKFWDNYKNITIANRGAAQGGR